MGMSGERKALRRQAMRRFRGGGNVGKKSPRSVASPVSTRDDDTEDNSDPADSASSKKSGPWSRFVFGARGRKMEGVKKTEDRKAPQLSLQEDASVEEWSHGSVPNGMLAVPKLSNRSATERTLSVSSRKNSSEIHEVQKTCDTIRRVVPSALQKPTRTVDATSSSRFWADEGSDHEEEDDGSVSKLRANSSVETLKEEQVVPFFEESEATWSVRHWRSPVSVLDTALFLGDNPPKEEQSPSSTAGAQIAAEWAISRSYANLVKHEAEISLNEEAEDSDDDGDESSQRSC